MHTSKLSKKKLAEKKALIKEQRNIRNSINSLSSIPKLSIPEDRNTRNIPSLDSGIGNAVKKESSVYTGDQVVGIAIMHKSCLQPVFNKEQAIDSASMRR